MTIVLKVQGMTCGACETHVTEALTGVAGVSSVVVNRGAGTATVRWATRVPDVDALMDAVSVAGYDASIVRVSDEGGGAVNAATAACGCGPACCQVPA
jgi:copper chaperone CopZ